MEVKNENENELVINDGVVDNNLEQEGVGDTNLVETSNNQVETTNEETTLEQDKKEEIHQTYSEEQVQKMLQARTDSINRKHQKELKKYREAENILKQGLNVETMDDVNKQLKSFYSEQGIEIKEDSLRDERDERILAKSDVEEIISFGDEEMNNTAMELYNKKNRTVREEAVLNGLIKEISLRRANEELRKIGADESVINSNEFKTFASKFNRDVPLTEIYNFYNKSNRPVRKQPASSGSMKTNENNSDSIKDFYTVEEARRFSRKDIDNNPKLAEAISNSMLKWGKNH